MACTGVEQVFRIFCGVIVRLNTYPSLVAFISLLVMSTSVAAEPSWAIKAGKLASEGNFAQAYCTWRKYANAGNRDAQHSLGWMYHNGYGMMIDETRASYWWRKAAEQDHLEAQFDLGMLYFRGGRKFKRNREQATKYILTAAVRGHTEARALLTYMARDGGENIASHVELLLKDGADLLLPSHKVTGNMVNVRAGPDTKFAVAGKLTRNTFVAEIGRDEKWLHVISPSEGVAGWVYMPLLESIPKRGN